MILFFDTETTGFFRRDEPLAHPAQPHLCQFAAELTHDDGTTISEISIVIDPTVPIPSEASAVHGISDDLARSAGMREATALGFFNYMAARADTVVGHNVEFDINVMRVLAARCGQQLADVRPECTKELAAPIVNLPPTEKMIAAGFTGPKAPTLTECIRHFFNEDFGDAHDANADVKACKRVYFEIQKIKEKNNA